MTKKNKFGIIIIESLPNHETKTGLELHNSTIKYKTFEEPVLSSEYYDIDNKQDFFKLFKKLVLKASIEKEFFVIHFEIHGYENGIKLKNDEEICWEEVLPYFIEINTHFLNYLNIYLAVCKRANLIKYINPNERSPFGAIVSSEKNIYVKHIVEGFEKFYEHFFFSFDVVESLEKYNSIVENEKDKLIFLNTKNCFDAIADINRDENNKKHQINLYVEFIKQNFNNSKYFSQEYLEKIAEDRINQIYEELQSRKSYFLMEDLK